MSGKLAALRVAGKVSVSRALCRRTVEHLAENIRWKADPPGVKSFEVELKFYTLYTLLEIAEWVLDEQAAGRCNPPAYLLRPDKKP